MFLFYVWIHSVLLEVTVHSVVHSDVPCIGPLCWCDICCSRFITFVLFWCDAVEEYVLFILMVIPLHCIMVVVLLPIPLLWRPFIVDEATVLLFLFSGPSTTGCSLCLYVLFSICWCDYIPHSSLHSCCCCYLLYCYCWSIIIVIVCYLFYVILLELLLKWRALMMYCYSFLCDIILFWRLFSDGDDDDDDDDDDDGSWWRRDDCCSVIYLWWWCDDDISWQWRRKLWRTVGGWPAWRSEKKLWKASWLQAAEEAAATSSLLAAAWKLRASLTWPKPGPGKLRYMLSRLPGLGGVQWPVIRCSCSSVLWTFYLLPGATTHHSSHWWPVTLTASALHFIQTYRWVLEMDEGR